MDVPNLTLNDGAIHPMIGFGTYKVGVIPASASSQAGVGAIATANTQEVVKKALDCGYQFLDCAQFYNNEKDIGEAIAASGIKRESLFLASKVWGDRIYEGRDAVRAQFMQTLEDLQTDYLDLYLVHWPIPGKHVEAYKVLEDLKKEGKVKSIGLSNYTIEDFEELMQQATITPSINQIEVNPFLYRRKTIDFFQGKGVAIQAYRPLRQGKEMQNPTLVALAEKHGKTPAQILGRWCIQKKIIYIPKSEKESRMKENAAVNDFTLSDEDISGLDTLTTPKALEDFKELYMKCVIRDTPLEKTKEGIKQDITID